MKNSTKIKHKKKLNRNFGVENTMFELKNTTESFNNRLEKQGEKIRKLRDNLKLSG